MHERCHEEESQTRDGVRIERGLKLFSRRLGLVGVADVVEFSKPRAGEKVEPFPIEYKHGKPKTNNCDKVQLCAQAICLEEMMSVSVSCGAIFYGRTRHRLDVVFDAALRQETEDVSNRLHEFIRLGITPKPQYSEKCEQCSLSSICLPKICGKSAAVSAYLSGIIEELKNEKIS